MTLLELETVFIELKQIKEREAKAFEDAKRGK
jgi:hypothetical protein